MKRFRVFIKEYMDVTTGDILPYHNIGIDRLNMPQIAKADVPEFLEFIKSQGISVEKRKYLPNSLYATQSELNQDKINGMREPESRAGFIIISKDNYVLDGHHRWAAALKFAPYTEIDTYQANTSVLELIRLANQFPKTFKKALHEQKLSGLTLYHGSNAKFDKFDQKKARIANDYFGGGVAYFTDDPAIAKQYALGMSKKTGAPTVYEVEVSFKDVFDVDMVFQGKDLTKFLKYIKAEDLARGAGLLPYGSNKYAVISSIESGEAQLTGEQIFKGLSRGMINTAAAREILIKLGYDGLRHNGGVNMGGKRHNVYLAYNADQITIKHQ